MRLPTIEEVHREIPHRVWLHGPEHTPSQIGVRGWAYAPYRTPDVNVIEPHVVVLYLVADTLVARWSEGRAEREEMRRGDISLCPARAPSRWLWRAPLEVLHIYITPAHFHATAREVRGASAGELRLRSALKVRDPIIMRLAEAMIDELTPPRAIGAELAARALGEMLLVRLLRDHVTVVDHHGDGARRARAQRFIAEHLDAALGLDDIAAHLDVGRHHLCRLFRQWFDRSPMAYVREVRLDQAQRLLAVGDTPVSEIAQRTGFADQSHLTRCFKDRFGLPPARWRRQNALLS